MYGADTEIFIKFMEWLENENNYHLFMNENIGWDPHFYFTRSHLEPPHPENIPVNYIEEVEGVLTNYLFPLQPEALYNAYFTDETLDNLLHARREIISEYAAFMYNMQTAGFRSLDVLQAHMIDRFIEEQDENESVRFMKEIFALLNK